VTEWLPSRYSTLLLKKSIEVYIEIVFVVAITPKLLLCCLHCHLLSPVR
jgi:hypothetical protein